MGEKYCLPLCAFWGTQSCTFPELLPLAAFIKISVMADAMRFAYMFWPTLVSFCFYTKRRCFRKKAMTVARIPQGPPWSWKMPYLTFSSK